VLVPKAQVKWKCWTRRGSGETWRSWTRFVSGENNMWFYFLVSILV